MTIPRDADLMVRAKLVLSPMGRDEQVQTLRAAATALGNYAGEPFQGADSRARDFLAGGPPGAILVLRFVHPAISDRSDPDSDRIKITVASDGPGEPTYVFPTFDIGRSGEKLAYQWEMGKLLLPRLIEALRPGLGFMNGDLVTNESKQALPRRDDLPKSGLPLAFTPWTYLSKERIASANVEPRSITSLPAARITPLDDGWVIEAIENLGEAPDARFAKDLDALAGTPIRYLRPEIGRART